jgi:hypothetical protein
MNSKWILTAAALVLSPAANASEELRVEVESTYTRAFITPSVYEYTVENFPSSTKAIEVFALDLGSPPPKVSEVKSPAGWSFRTCGRDPEKLCWIWDRGDVGRLGPGQKLSGFGFRSWPKPADGRYFIGGTPSGESALDLDGRFDQGFLSAPVRGPRGGK